MRDEEVLGGDFTATVRSFDDDRAAERGEAERQLRASIRVRDRTSNRAAIPGTDMPDVRERLAGKRVRIILARLSDRSTRSRRMSSSPTGAVWPVVKSRCTTVSTAVIREGSSSGDGTR